ncbi:MAG: sulfur carrier protein ThiS [Chitinispirillales bacterium]|jgi:thiamine biosynthesis protein ThiS|nr:sulfur carrier protein ThiS [Chitinispirillales bacterium]
MIVNGKNIDQKETAALKDYLESAGYDPSRIAVEKNGVIIPKDKFSSETVCNDDTLEIVRFVGGG